MKILVNQTAPDFIAKDINGHNVKLSDFRGQKIILGFYRNVSCPFCNRRVHQLMSYNMRLKNAGVQMIFLFESSNQKIVESSFHKGITPWPIIGNPERDIYDVYGVGSSMVKMMRTFVSSNITKALKETKALNLPADKDASMTLIPADFFIDENFKVVKAHYGKHIDDHVPFEDIKAFSGLESLFDKL